MNRFPHHVRQVGCPENAGARTGEKSDMKLRTLKQAAQVLAGAATLWVVGCSSSSPNQTVVTVSPATATILAGQSTSLTASVTGPATVLTVTWKCTWTTTTTSTDSTGKVTTTTATGGCDPSSTAYPKYGSVSDETQNVITYTAPPLSAYPQPAPVITLTATSTAEKTKTGAGTVSLDSGIRASITPSSATVPVGLKIPATVKFTASFLNDNGTDATWLVTQPVLGSTGNPTATSSSPTCSPGCGTIDQNGVFTAPATVPTNTFPVTSTSTTANPAQVTVVVSSKKDTAQAAAVLITLVNASTNPQTFTAIFPTTAAAGGVEQDIWLDAHNVLNTTAINFIDPLGNNYNLDPTTQIFTIPITSAYCTTSSTVSCDSSIVTRIRLNAQQLANPGTGQISMNIPDPNNPGSLIAKSFPLTLYPARPGLVASVPQSFRMGSNTTFTADGGYYGAGLAKLLFNGNPGVSIVPTNARQFSQPLPGSQIQNPGLYQVSVLSNAQGNAPPFPSATTNVAVQPNYANLGVPVSNPLPTTAATGTNLAPSSMALDSAKSYAVITEQASNSIQYVDLSSGTPTTNIPPFSVTNPQTGKGLAPTGVAIDDQLGITVPADPVAGSKHDLAVVVNNGDSTLSLIALPNANYQQFTFLTTVDMSKLLVEPPGVVTVQPAPFAIGVDPTTHLGAVAYSNSNLGFIVNVNPIPVQNPSPNDPTQKCFNGSTVSTPPCAISSVSMNTGATPQVAVQPQVPVAYVSPGGAGLTSVINLTQTNSTVDIAPTPNGAVLVNGIVTIKTVTAHGINASVGGTVLISGLDTSDLDGSYQVTSVIDPYTFTYAVNNTKKNESGGSPTSGAAATVQYGSPYLTFNIANSTVGVSIDPVTRTAVFADPGATVAQILLLKSLDLTVSSITLQEGAYQGSPSGTLTAPEPGIRFAAIDPYTNVIITFNPTESINNISLIDPVGTASASPGRILPAIPTGQVGTGSYTPSGGTAVTVYGAMVYDPNTKLVLVANAGSNSLTYLNVDPTNMFKPVHVQGIVVTAGGVPNAQAPLNSTTGASDGGPISCNPANPTGLTTCMPQGALIGAPSATVQVFGAGFAKGAQVRLDGNSSGITTTYVSPAQLTATIPATYLTLPHDFALDVAVGNNISNATDFYAVGATDLTPICAAAKPEAVAIDPVRNVGVVTLNGCTTGMIAIVNLDYQGLHSYGKPYGQVLATANVGNLPLGVDVIPRLGYAVVANNKDGTASIIDISNPLSPQVLSFTSGTTTSSSVTVGISPSGVTIDQDHAYALIADTGASTVSLIDLTVLQKSPIGTPVSVPIAVDSQPFAIAVDPNRAIAVVTALQQVTVGTISGVLDVITLTGTPAKSTSSPINSLSAAPTGIVCDPAPNPALFYATSPQLNSIYTFNPDTGSTQSVRVGVNPFSIAYNYQTGTLLSVNAASTGNSISVIDSQTQSTQATVGIGSQAQFAAAMDNVYGTAVMADQNNNRVLFVPMPK
jgi:DNA-binding beta-propeller fold protein YncE